MNPSFAAIFILRCQVEGIQQRGQVEANTGKQKSQELNYLKYLLDPCYSMSADRVDRIHRKTQLVSVQKI